MSIPFVNFSTMSDEECHDYGELILTVDSARMMSFYWRDRAKEALAEGDLAAHEYAKSQIAIYVAQQDAAQEKIDKHCKK